LKGKKQKIVDSSKIKESPEFVRLSLAAAMTLRLASGRFYRNARLYCINLLLTYSNGCAGRCSYCGLSRQRIGEYGEKTFIRVAWPTYRLSTIRERIRQYAGWVERICISMITNPRSAEDTTFIIRYLREELDLFVSLLITPTIVTDTLLEKFREAGADMVGVAIDTATEELFKRHRGEGVRGPHRWEIYWQVMDRAVGVFGKGKVGCHLIVGLGETEQEMVETMQRVRDLGARTHLFSFYPEPGSPLQDKPPCNVSQYRRIQLARYLIDHDLSRAEQMEFDAAGKMVGYGLPTDKIDEIVNSGRPFQTSGCPGKSMDGACNRPFGDGPPSDIRSFPFELSEEDIHLVKQQIRG
jgi:biotin synthase